MCQDVLEFILLAVHQRCESQRRLIHILLLPGVILPRSNPPLLVVLQQSTGKYFHRNLQLFQLSRNENAESSSTIFSALRLIHSHTEHRCLFYRCGILGDLLGVERHLHTTPCGRVFSGAVAQPLADVW
ncbi:hypothetical protein SKAU_G00384540 [Synaphobranchus kaupii]|uniref:Uncharacterized protein n=1 Tax=Synaphobranchus kaupii TaxID=118154 RepID=A0A9Q1EEB1_SYNKA|nr:hypothetical protein SKAU_G00384540 [Synaphobranchus kaupii]